MTTSHYDLIIVGGGMVGASLAIALKNSALNIAIVEAFDYQVDEQPSYDDRGIAVSYGSQRILSSMGLWSELVSYATAISDIHVSDKGHFGATRLSAQQEQVPALGYVILAREMGKVFNSALKLQQNLDIISPARVIDLKQSDETVSLTLDNHQKINAKLIVAADGADSKVRQLLKLGALKHDYHQTAITANVSTKKPHKGCAFERFSQTGPVALLPMSDNRSSLIWTVKPEQVDALLSASDDEFLAQLQDHFGFRLGRFTRVGKRQSYPLTLNQTDNAVQHRIVFIGNAAHSLHPIAGQGFNLGLRDVATLADIIVDQHNDCGATSLLHDYKIWQQPDQDQIIKATNLLVSLFSNDNSLLGHGRAACLSLLDSIPPAKHWFAKKSMGIAKKQPRLARGISL
jgi:2-octaprenyl-6-methoxyphenol hydroxylase